MRFMYFCDKIFVVMLKYVYFCVLLFYISYFMVSEELDKKITRSCLLIRKAYRHCRHRRSKLEVCISGGKDSDVLIELCKMSGVWGGEWLRPLHKSTSIDPRGTLSHVKSLGVEVLRPRLDFRGCIHRSGFPNRYIRHCCGELKEYAVEDYALLGIRRCESVSRRKLYLEPEQCRTYNGRGKAIQYYPILDWSNDDVREFIEWRGIKCHPLYYDADGVFHVERRLGCMCCPLSSFKHRISEFMENPRMVRFYLRAGLVYWDSHQDSSVRSRYRDVYEWFVSDVLCKDYDDFLRRFRGDGDLFGASVDCKVYLENYFGIGLDF